MIIKGIYFAVDEFLCKQCRGRSDGSDLHCLQLNLDQVLKNVSRLFQTEWESITVRHRVEIKLDEAQQG